MFDFFNTFGFGTAGEPEALNNTREVISRLAFIILTPLAWSSSQHLGRFSQEDGLEGSGIG